MGTVKPFYEYMNDMSDTERKAHTRKLVRMRADGKSYKYIAEMLGGYRPNKVSRYLKYYEQTYHEEVRNNLQRLENSVSTPNPDYVYMTDKRTVLREMCALAMGGAEIVSALKQLMNIKGEA